MAETAKKRVTPTGRATSTKRPDPRRLPATTSAADTTPATSSASTAPLPADDPDLFEAPDDDAVERALGSPVRDGALWRAFAALSDRCKSLLRLLISDEEPSYEEVGAALGMPVGAIGPTRMRYSRAINVVDSLSRTINRVFDNS